MKEGWKRMGGTVVLRTERRGRFGPHLKQFCVFPNIASLKLLSTFPKLVFSII
jgi:hypothetical protein